MIIRPYTGTDEAQLLRVWQQAMTRDRIDEAIFRTKVLLDPNFRPENLPVATIEDGQIVGFVLSLTRRVPLFLQGLEPDKSWITAFGVLPEYRRRGIGTALFTSTLDRLRADERQTVEISPYVPNYFAPGIDLAYSGTLDFLQRKLGFTVQETATSMGIDLSGFNIPAEIVELAERREREDGLTIAPVTGADLPDLMSFISDNFGWDWFRHLQEYLVEYFGDSSRQVCFLVARLNGRVVGFCGQRRERFGPFGVDATVRNLGIGRLLLFRCLAEMSARHFYYAYFMWTGEDAARLYTLAGFRKRREFAILGKHLTP